MRILLFGKNGQVGRAVTPLLLPLGDLACMDYAELDITDSDKLRGVLRTLKPDVIVNASAYTNVDLAETEKEPAWKVNAEAPRVMMEELNQWNGALIHYSTDYVFDGSKHKPYVEDDAPNPINEYGRSKLGGDELIRAVGGRYLILRTSWVYAEGFKNFVSSILHWAVTQEVLRIVDDQIGSPTWATMLAEQTAGLLATRQGDLFDFIQEHAGVYHCAGKGAVSRYDFAMKVLSLLSDSDRKVKATDVIPARSGDFPSPALRPVYSALDCARFENTFGVILPAWDVSLFHALLLFQS